MSQPGNTDQRKSGPPETDRDDRRELDSGQRADFLREVSRVLNVFLRVLRARQGKATGVVEALDDFFEGISSLLELYGEITVRVAIDGLYTGEQQVLEVSPREEPALFRIFQYGIRQISFLPGLSRKRSALLPRC